LTDVNHFLSFSYAVKGNRLSEDVAPKGAAFLVFEKFSTIFAIRCRFFKLLYNKIVRKKPNA
jgi:hypothetical protein